MKRVQVILAVLLTVASASAQQALNSSTNAPGTTNSTTFSAAPIQARPLLQEEPRAAETDSIVGKAIQLSGPLAQPLRSRKVKEAPKRFWQWFSPVAKPEPERRLEKSGTVSPRAWTEVVGWHPGGSAFADATTHESSMKLLIITRPDRE